MKKLILNSHPCEPKVMYWMEKEARKGTEIYIKQHLERYVKRWGEDPSNIKIIPDELYERTFPSELRHKD